MNHDSMAKVSVVLQTVSPGEARRLLPCVAAGLDWRAGWPAFSKLDTVGAGAGPGMQIWKLWNILNNQSYYPRLHSARLVWLGALTDWIVIC